MKNSFLNIISRVLDNYTSQEVLTNGAHKDDIIDIQDLTPEELSIFVSTMNLKENRRTRVILQTFLWFTIIGISVAVFFVLLGVSNSAAYSRNFY